MKHTQLYLLAACITCCCPSGAFAAGIKVIANSSVAADSISSDDLREIFLETRSSFPDGAHAEPVLARDGLSHQAFIHLYLGKDNPALQAYYRTLVFTGKAAMPHTEASDTEVIAYVARTKGAIGYVSSTAPTPSVKTLAVR